MLHKKGFTEPLMCLFLQGVLVPYNLYFWHLDEQCAARRFYIRKIWRFVALSALEGLPGFPNALMDSPENLQKRLRFL